MHRIKVDPALGRGRTAAEAGRQVGKLIVESRHDLADICLDVSDLEPTLFITNFVNAMVRYVQEYSKLDVRGFSGVQWQAAYPYESERLAEATRDLLSVLFTEQ